VSTSLRSLLSFKPLGFLLEIKAKADKSNSLEIDWRHRLNIGIGLFFRFDIMASKEYYLTIVGSLKVYSKVTCRHATSSDTCSIAKM